MQRAPDGDMVRDQVKAGQRHYGPNWWPEGLEPVECPPTLEYLWEYFLSLHIRREAGKFLDHADVQAWAHLRGRTLQVYELDALDRVEGIFVHLESKAIAAAMRAAAKGRK